MLDMRGDHYEPDSAFSYVSPSEQAFLMKAGVEGACRERWPLRLHSANDLEGVRCGTPLVRVL